MRGSYKHASARSRNTVTGAWWLVSVAAHPVQTLREGKSTGWSEVCRNRTPVLTLAPRPQARIPSHFFFSIIRRYVCFVPPCFSIIRFARVEWYTLQYPVRGRIIPLGALLRGEIVHSSLRLHKCNKGVGASRVVDLATYGDFILPSKSRQ